MTASTLSTSQTLNIFDQFPKTTIPLNFGSEISPIHRTSEFSITPASALWGWPELVLGSDFLTNLDADALRQIPVLNRLVCSFKKNPLRAQQGFVIRGPNLEDLPSHPELVTIEQEEPRKMNEFLLKYRDIMDTRGKEVSVSGFLRRVKRFLS